jgi:hypothetical protein
MTSKIIPFILGGVIGAAVTAGLLFHQSNQGEAKAVQEASLTYTQQMAALETALSSARTRLEESQQLNDSMTVKIQELMKRPATQSSQSAPAASEKPKGLAALFGGDGTNGVSKTMTDMIKSAVEQQLEAKVAALKTRLGLTAEQETAIREILAKQMGLGSQIAEKMMKGELSQEELQKLAKDKPNQKDQIKSVLTAEQVKEYDAYETEEKNRMARLVANAELMQMQSQLQLDEAQQDKVFAVIAEQTQLQLDAKESDPMAALDFRGQAAKKAEAMKEVLTPEQFERYQKFQEQQLKLIEAFMPKKSTNSASPQ